MAERQIAKHLGSDGDELLAALLDSMVDAVYAVDQGGAVLFANRAAVSTLGYDSEEELLGRPSHATIHYRHPDGRPFPESKCPLLRPRASGEAVRVEQDWFIRRDGTFVPVAYSSAPITIRDHRGAVVVFHDLTERDRADAERDWRRRRRRRALSDRCLISNPLQRPLARRTFALADARRTAVQSP